MNWFRRTAITAISLATPIIMIWEGESLTAYIDPVGIPTICYGHTANVQMGDVKSHEECLDLLSKEVRHFANGVDKLVKPSMTPEVHAAFTSFSYNVGLGAFSKSTALRKLNAGDTVGACNELKRWVYAGGRKMQGLVNRRNAERELCLRGAF